MQDDRSSLDINTDPADVVQALARTRAELATVREQLSTTTQRLEAAQQLARCGSWSWIPATGLVWWSDAQYKLFGLKPGQVCPSYDVFLNLVYSEDQVIARQRVQAMLAGAETFEDDLRIVRADGTVIWIRSQAKATRDAQGRIVIVEGIDQDITKQKLSTSALRESESRLQLALRAASAIAFVWDAKSDLVTRYFSTESALPANLEHPEPVAAVRARVHPDDLHLFDAGIQNCLNAGTDYRNLYRVVRPDGSVGWLEEWGYLERGADGSPLSLTGVSIDVTASKESEMELRQASDLLNSVADSTSDVIFVKDRLGKYVFFNRAASDLVGRSSSEVLGNDDRSLFDAAGAERIMGVDQDVMRYGMPRTEYETLTANGITRSYHAIKSPHRNSRGEVVGVIGISRDITVQVKANAILREKTEFLNAVFQATPECMKILDGEGRIVDMNAFGLKMLDTDNLSDVEGKRAVDFVVPHDRERYVAFCKRVHNGQTGSIEFEMRTAKGRQRTVESYAVPVEINNQRMELSVTRDITDRKQTEEDLHHLWQNAIDPLCIAGDDGYFKKVNPAWTKSLGWSAEELTSRPWLEFVHPDDQAKTIAAGSTLLDGSPVANFENRYRCTDGTYRWFSWSTVPLAGAGISYGFVRDVTDIKRLAEQFHQAQKLEAIGRLAGGVAHDFNNLLTVINGYSDLMLLEYEHDSSSAQSLREIRNAGGRAARLTLQLLAFSRKSLVEQKAIDLNALIAESVSLLRRLIGEDVTLTFLPDDHLGKVLADPGQIEQVIMNLVVNSRDAMPRGGQLTISTQRLSLQNPHHLTYADLEPGEYSRLSVRDTGSGIAPEIMNKIFEPFFTTKDSTKGTGLGLAVAHGVVKQCGGHISVESRSDEGTAFHILLPVAIGAEQDSLEEPEIDTTDGPETVLLVEDEEAVRKIACMGLEAHGYRVLTAVDVESALSIARSHKGSIDLLITDIVMPGLGGRELVNALRVTRPDIRVLYISGYTDDAIVRYGIESTYENFLSKPFTPLVLARKARAVMDGSTSQ